MTFRGWSPAPLAAALLTLLSESSWSETPWPAAGAPVCVAPGDQGMPLHVSGVCPYVMGFSWFWFGGSGVGDSLASTYLAYQPPDGTCPPFSPHVFADAPRDAASTQIFSGMIAAIPGCIELTPAHVWVEGAGAAERLRVHTPVWDPPTLVVDDGEHERHGPRLAGSGTANPRDTAVVVVWSDSRTGVSQIRAQRLSQSGVRLWGPNGLLVAPTGAAQLTPDVVRLPDGSALIVWTDERSGGSDVYAMKLTTAGLPASGWPAGGSTLESRLEVSERVRLVSRPFGADLYVLWEEAGPRFGGGRQIVARRLAADGSPEPSWPEAGIPLGDVASVEHLEDASSRESGLVAVWTDTRDGAPANPTDLYAQRLLPDGARAPGWPAGGVPVCVATGRQERARVDVHPNGAAVFAWEDHRDSDTDVYVASIDDDGTIPCCRWVPDGLPAAVAPGNQTRPVIEADNASGAYVAWVDDRDAASTGTDIYAQVFARDGRNVDVPEVAERHGVRLLPPAPNPARQAVRLALELPGAARVRLEILDVAGRRVRTIADEDRSAGRHTWTWDGRDAFARAASPGLYLVRASVDGVALVRRLIRLPSR
jgi:hypothetical protein